MEQAKLVLQYIQVLAWPVFVGVAVFMLREPLKGLVARLRSAKFPGGEATFTESQLSAASEEMRAAKRDLKIEVGEIAMAATSADKAVAVGSVDSPVKVTKKSDVSRDFPGAISVSQPAVSVESTTRNAHYLSKGERILRGHRDTSTKIPHPTPAHLLDDEIERIRNGDSASVLGLVRADIRKAPKRPKPPKFTLGPDDDLVNPNYLVVTAFDQLIRYLKAVSIRFAFRWKDLDTGGARYFKLTQGSEPERFLLCLAIDLESRAILNLHKSVSSLRGAASSARMSTNQISLSYANRYLRVCRDVARVIDNLIG